MDRRRDGVDVDGIKRDGCKHTSMEKTTPSMAGPLAPLENGTKHHRATTAKTGTKAPEEAQDKGTASRIPKRKQSCRNARKRVKDD